jgi:RepB DNA-primase from phage plasmid
VQRRLRDPEGAANELANIRQVSWRYPDEADSAAEYLISQAQEERDAYFGIHLFREPGNRQAANALKKVRALWLDEDDGAYPLTGPEPSAVVHSSRSRRHLYWALTHPVSAQWAVDMNRRLAHWAGGDTSKAGLSSVLRAPGTGNFKRHPAVDLVIGEFTGQEEWDPEVLDQAVPEIPKPSSPARTVLYDGPEIDLAPYLERVEVLSEVADSMGTKCAIVCPWIQEHSGGDRTGTRVGQRANGACWFHCDHQHCQGRSWKDFKKKVLLGLRTKIRRPGYTGPPLEVRVYG